MTAGAPAPTSTTAANSALRLARTHYENFPVVSWLVPRELRAPLARVYEFARTTDDLGDEGSGTPAERLAGLDAWEAGLRIALGDHGDAASGPWRPDDGAQRETGGPGGVPPSPVPADADEREADQRVLRDTADLIREHRLPLQPFLDLIEANRLDQRRFRYSTSADLLESCRLSANPVGRIVLRLFGRDDQALHDGSDSICTGLQIANHLQGVGEDLRLRNRLYLPLEDLDRFGVDERDLLRDRPTAAVRYLFRFEIERARALLERGADLPEAFTGRRRAVLRLFIRGGSGILDRLERRLDDVLRARITIPRTRVALWIAAEGARAGLWDGRWGRW